MKNAFNTFMSILILAVLAAGVYFIVQTVRGELVAVQVPESLVKELLEK